MLDILGVITFYALLQTVWTSNSSQLRIVQHFSAYLRTCRLIDDAADMRTVRSNENRNTFLRTDERLEKTVFGQII